MTGIAQTLHVLWNVLTAFRQWDDMIALCRSCNAIIAPALSAQWISPEQLLTQLLQAAASDALSHILALLPLLILMRSASTRAIRHILIATNHRAFTRR
ncbi:hypothetical protein [Undibacterium curvum]|uniref:hypothetical protein n=1 Tax=Undibacterium curvum TaxID=2762294 RepID=UPI002E33897C|nr:hypothetical protein [Undibacterium curvum]